MSWLNGRRGYDRARLLESARKAAARGRHEKAIGFYERVLAVEPENFDLLRRVAGQRARAGQREQAWHDCQTVAEQLRKRGFVEQAVGVYRDFAHHLPDESSVWNALCDLQLERGSQADAIASLLEGRAVFKARAQRDQALALLRRARKIDSTHFEANFALAGLLARGGSKAPALRILKELEGHVQGRQRRRLRARIFRFSPGPRTAWRWLRACLGRS